MAKKIILLLMLIACTAGTVCSGQDIMRAEAETATTEAESGELAAARSTIEEQRHTISKLRWRLNVCGVCIVVITLITIVSSKRQYIEMYRERLRKNSSREMRTYRRNEALMRQYVDEIERLKARDANAVEEMGRLNRQLLILTNENREIRSSLMVNAVNLLKQLKDGLLIEENMTKREKEDVCKYMNSFYNDFAENLRREYKLNDNNVLLASLIKLDFSVAELVIVYDCEENSVYRKKQRLKERLGLAKEESLEAFLSRR